MVFLVLALIMTPICISLLHQSTETGGFFKIFACSAEDRIEDSVVALWVYLDLIITVIAVPWIYINIYLEKTFESSMYREIAMLLHREQMYE